MAQEIRERYINPYTDFGFKKLFGTDISKYTDAERKQYEESKKILWDNYSVIKTAYDKGWKEGWTAGIEEIARKMKSNGFSVEDIAEVTRLTINEIDVL